MARHVQLTCVVMAGFGLPIQVFTRNTEDVDAGPSPGMTKYNRSPLYLHDDEARA